MATPRLSKSRFTAGLQCHRLLWWRAHEPDAPELAPDAMQQAIFDQGTRVGEVARRYVPGGCLIDLPHDQVAAKIAATRQALATPTPAIYEASFDQDRIFVAVDILERLDGGFGIIEVKSSTSVKPEHLPDAAIQAHVLARNGLEVRRVEIMRLNRACTFPRLDDLFVREDVTEEVEALVPGVRRQADEQLRMLAGPLPERPIGAHCTSPYECPFLERCWEGVPDDHVTTLYRAGATAWDYVAQGCHRITALPPSLRLNPIAERQRRALCAGRRLVEPGLAEALAALERPLAFLDFETIAPAIPVWDGCHPYDQVPVQFSCHVEDGAGGWAHHEWLAEGPDDPRRAIGRRVAEACAGAATVLAYNAPFEKGCLDRLAARADADTAAALHRVRGRIDDLLPLLRDHVYDPAFGGGFGLKTVLPVLVPDLSYQDLPIAEGGLATAELERVLLRRDGMAPGEVERLRRDLLRYCERDTWATVRLLDALRALAPGSA